MKTFWTFAARLLHYRGSMLLALFGAIISAGGFGAGILTIPIVFKALVLTDGETLPAILTRMDSKYYGLIPRFIIDVAPQDRFAGVVFALSGILVMSLIAATGRVMHAYFAMSAAMQCVASVREDAFRNVVRLPLSTLVEKGTFDRVSRIIKDTNQLRAGLITVTSKAVTKSYEAVIALSVAFFFDYRLCLIALLVTPGIGIAIRVFGNRVRKASRRALKQAGFLLATIVEALQGARVVKVHTAEDHEVEQFCKVNDRLLNEELSMRRSKALASPIVEALTVMGIVVVAMIAAWYIIRNDVNAEHVLYAIGLLAFAGASGRPLTQLWTDLQESAAAAERITSLLAQPIEHDSAADAQPLAKHQQSIEFRGVSFGYPNAEREALTNIDLSINSGETVAFVGPNGSGKTTLLSLIPRLFDPDTGTVRIDGVDLTSATLSSIRGQIGVVTQETVIFNDTIANNIAYGAGAVSREQVEAAARRAFADEFICRKPKGYDTSVGEAGVALSGGERQRIAIARAILRNPRILILDEATSQIDADSEAQIAEALGEFCKDRTSLVIAHRLSTVVNADRIVVMSVGRIVDIGTHTQLLERCDLYQQLCRTQLVEGNENGNEKSRSSIPDPLASTATSGGNPQGEELTSELPTAP